MRLLAMTPANCKVQYTILQQIISSFLLFFCFASGWRHCAYKHTLSNLLTFCYFVFFFVFLKLDEMREKYEDLKMESEEKMREHTEKVSTRFLFVRTLFIRTFMLRFKLYNCFIDKFSLYMARNFLHERVIKTLKKVSQLHTSCPS